MNIAVAISHYGRNIKWLERSLNSIISTNHNVYIFLHLDGCKDLEIAMPPNCKIIKSNEPIGLAKGLNKIFASILKHNIIFDFIMRMDDDDICFKERIDKQVAFMESNPTIDFSGTLMSIIDENEKVIVSALPHQVKNNQSWDERFLAGGCHIAHPTVMFRGKMLYDGNLWYNPLYKELEDYELWFRLLRLKFIYDVVPDVLLLYRSHPGQETRRNNAAKNKVVNSVLEYFRENWGSFLC